MLDLAIVCHDEVNEQFILDRVSEQGVTIATFTHRDPPPGPAFSRILLCWDSLCSNRRESLLADLLNHSASREIGLMSYNVLEEDAESLSRKGVALFQDISQATNWLLDGRV